MAAGDPGGVPWHLGFPLAASVLYVVGVMFVKRTSDLGVDFWRATFVANIAGALAFLCLFPLGGTIPALSLFWQPALIALLFILGQGLSFLALKRGDVSVATPVMGVKVVIVAILATVLLREMPSLKFWIGAGLSSLALFLLNQSGEKRHHDVGFTIIVSVIAAACFALFDVLVQKWSPVWGPGPGCFLPIMFGFVAVFSLALIPFFEAPLRKIPRSAWPPLSMGALFIALQGLFMVTGIAIYGDATAANIVYSSRGLWSVAAVWLVGHWFLNKEQHLSRTTLAWRLTGAAVLMIAVLMVLV